VIREAILAVPDHRPALVEIIFVSMPTLAATARSYSSGTVAENRGGQAAVALAVCCSWLRMRR